MDRFDAMQVFALIVERRSFTEAAVALNLPRATVTQAIQRLERQLGVQLLHRTTRKVAPTVEGEAFYRHTLQLITALEDAERSVRARPPSGRLRIDVPGALAPLLFPRLPDFARAYPGIEFEVDDGRCGIELVREGVDCAVRMGELHDSTLVTVRVATLQAVTAAAPAYCQRHGLPASIEALRVAQGHIMVGLLPQRADAPMPLQFQYEGGVHHVALPTLVRARSASAYVDAALSGFGIIQAPRYRLDAHLAAGRLTSVLDAFPPLPCPLSIAYAKTRSASPCLRTFIEWAVDVFHEQG